MPATEWSVRGRVLSLGRPLVMGILNVTPDSFSDGGRYADSRTALVRAERMIAEGAEIVDVGGESTRPGATPVDEDEERARVVPVVRAIIAAHPDAVVSVDTVKSTVAESAIAAGASIVNDVSAGRLDAGMAGICARHRVGVILMHSRGAVEEMAALTNASYGEDVMSDVLDELRPRVDAFRTAGVGAASIALDPGIGFGKRGNQSLRLLAELMRLGELGHPVVVGLSRKRFIGELTAEREPAARLHGSVGAAVAAYDRGANVLRVHDVRATRQALDVAHAIRSAVRE